MPLLTMSADKYFHIFVSKLIGQLSLILSRSPRIPKSPHSFIQFWTMVDGRPAPYWRYTEQLNHTFRPRLELTPEKSHRGNIDECRRILGSGWSGTPSGAARLP